MSEKIVTIEIDGKACQAPAGAMLIDVADDAGIPIPRFCYHKKLSVAANCRMCLVEVEKVPKPLPACATPVNDGMKVSTRSPVAIAAQKGTMEFLLINHPLDCPICDQGGECELQDVSMAYGSDVSRYTEGKRVVMDKDVGPLVSTDLTRCIQCTRCVRFGAEIAGIRELGATGRGEHMQIGTYIEKSIDSELSGNIVDVCPVGALTSRPFRFTARAWEMKQYDSVAAHDSVGANIHLHVRNGKVMRVVPKENESVNECWLSDRDRYSYQAVGSDQRLTRPRIRKNGKWQDVTWEEALKAAADGLKAAAARDEKSVASLVSPNATCEEIWLVRSLMEGLGSEQIDYRLRQGDFRPGQPDMPWLGMPVEALEQLENVLIIGANPRHDQPLLGHRLRKAAMAGAQISFINPMNFDLNYRADQTVCDPAGMIDELAAIGKGLNLRRGIIGATKAKDRHKSLAKNLKAASKSAVLLGPLALAHPDASMLWALASAVAGSSDSVLGLLPEASNSVGAGLICDSTRNGSVDELLANPRKAYLVVDLEAGRDFGNPAGAHKALEQADCVVALSAWQSADLDATSDVQLPIGLFCETSGTRVNAAGTWQSFEGVVSPPGEARPAWKVLRVLGNTLELEGFDYQNSGEVLAKLRDALDGREPENTVKVDVNEERRTETNGLIRLADTGIYATDPLTRRAEALQKTRLASPAHVEMNTSSAQAKGLENGSRVKVHQGGEAVELELLINDGLPDSVVRVQQGLEGTETLGAGFTAITVEQA
jgi:NADH-quinone oxidoreductase subunit G